MNAHPKELPIPGPARADMNAIEIVRIWASGGKQYVSLTAGLWKDPASWGIMLVDLAKHVANAYKQSTGVNHGATLRRLKEGFDAEWGTPTDEPTGKIEK